MGAALRLVLKLAVAAALGFGAWLAWHLHTPRPLPVTPLEFAITQGSSLRATAVQLHDAGLIPNPWAFVLLGRILGRAGEIKAGHYQVSEPMSPRALLDLVTHGMVTQSAIKFIEGWTLKQVRRALDEHPDLKHETPALSEAQLAQAVGVAEGGVEGLIFPDTYYFPKGASDLSVLKRAYRSMEQELAAAWSARAPDLPLASPYEGLILASIVEKETGVAAERSMISGVFVNRLKRGMRLETDPAVIYGLGEAFDGNLRKRDLLADTPYNTYTRAGLPPTPIAMPGQASLEAALNPTRTNALYFVARGDGTSHFSATLAEHERAVTKYQRKR